MATTAARLVLVITVAFTTCSASRGLLQTDNARCPAACDSASDGCVRDGTASGLRCVRCLSNFVVQRATGTCGCSRGRFGNGTGCADCPVGAFCPGGTVTAPDALQPSQLVGPESVACGLGLTTIGVRSVSRTQCVNQPGYAFTLSGALLCPADTFSSGLKKQPSCTPCGSGFTTAGALGSTNWTACLAAPGYFQLAPGQAAACPQGEYKEGYDATASCTPCAPGVTTPRVGSTSPDNCTDVLPGVYAAEMDGPGVTSTQPCPQDHYCPGGTATAATWSGAGSSSAAAQVFACPNAKWTKEPGASSVSACLVPPGYSLAAGEGATIQPCGDGSYRSGWSFGAASCAACGIGIASHPVDILARFDAATGDPAADALVRSGPAACFIRRGQGMWLSSDGVYRAANCSANSFGVAGLEVYGLGSNPCRDCPAGMQTSEALANSNRFRDNSTGGFFDPMACVTRKGWGLNGRQASRCQQGMFNDEGGYSRCSPCPYGTTTKASPAPDGSDQDAADDCTIAPGFGLDAGVIKVCPLGTFNDEIRANTSAPCTPCDEGSTTTEEGASSPKDSSCSVCAEGWGGDGPNCANPMRCGGGRGAAATYGPPGRGPSQPGCIACPGMASGFSFNWADAGNEFRSQPVARLGATSPADCLAEFAQLEDGAFSLATSDAPAASSRAASLEACAAACAVQPGCMWLTYDYAAAGGADNCAVYSASGSANAILAFKAVPAGDLVATGGKRAGAKALASGRYSFYRHSGSSMQHSLGTATRTLQGCFESCDMAGACAGVAYDAAAMAAGEAPCTLLGAAPGIDTGLRSLVRADVTRLAVPAAV